MAFDDIPEDRDESYPCPVDGCDGTVSLLDHVWECDTCDWKHEEPTGEEQA